MGDVKIPSGVVVVLHKLGVRFVNRIGRIGFIDWDFSRADRSGGSARNAADPGRDDGCPPIVLLQELAASRTTQGGTGKCRRNRRGIVLHAGFG